MLNSIKKIEIHGYDINPASIDIAKNRLKNNFPDLHLNLHNTDFLQM